MQDRDAGRATVRCFGSNVLDGHRGIVLQNRYEENRVRAGQVV